MSDRLNESYEEQVPPNYYNYEDAEEEEDEEVEEDPDAEVTAQRIIVKGEELEVNTFVAGNRKGEVFVPVPIKALRLQKHLEERAEQFANQREQRKIMEMKNREVKDLGINTHATKTPWDAVVEDNVKPDNQHVETKCNQVKQNTLFGENKVTAVFAKNNFKQAYQPNEHEFPVLGA